MRGARILVAIWAISMALPTASARAQVGGRHQPGARGLRAHDEGTAGAQSANCGPG